MIDRDNNGIPDEMDYVGYLMTSGEDPYGDGGGSGGSGNNNDYNARAIGCFGAMIIFYCVLIVPSLDSLVGCIIFIAGLIFLILCAVFALAFDNSGTKTIVTQHIKQPAVSQQKLQQKTEQYNRLYTQLIALMEKRRTREKILASLPLELRKFAELMPEKGRIFDYRNVFPNDAVDFGIMFFRVHIADRDKRPGALYKDGCLVYNEFNKIIHIYSYFPDCIFIDSNGVKYDGIWAPALSEYNKEWIINFIKCANSLLKRNGIAYLSFKYGKRQDCLTDNDFPQKVKYRTEFTSKSFEDFINYAVNYKDLEGIEVFQTWVSGNDNPNRPTPGKHLNVLMIKK